MRVFAQNSRRLVALAFAICLACVRDREAPEIPEPMEFQRQGCQVVADKDRPFIVGWASTDLSVVETSLTHDEPIVVAYPNCYTIKVLDKCRVSGLSYQYIPVYTKSDKFAFRHYREIEVTIPLGLAELGAQLRGHKELQVKITAVGNYLASSFDVYRSQLQGACDDATHVVYRVHVGAYESYVLDEASGGAGIRVGQGPAVGGGALSSVERISHKGDIESCDDEGGKQTDGEPPRQCGVPLRLEFIEIQAGGPVAAQAAAKNADAAVAVVEPTPVAPTDASADADENEVLKPTPPVDQRKPPPPPPGLIPKPSESSPESATEAKPESPPILEPRPAGELDSTPPKPATNSHDGTAPGDVTADTNEEPHPEPATQQPLSISARKQALAASGGILIGLSAVGVGTLIAGVVGVNQAESEFQSGSTMQDRLEANAAGARAEKLVTAGAVITGMLVTAGTVLLLAGKLDKNKKSKSLSVQPAVGPFNIGLTIGGAF